jgi:hypothetical protein
MSQADQREDCEDSLRDNTTEQEPKSTGDRGETPGTHDPNIQILLDMRDLYADAKSLREETNENIQDSGFKLNPNLQKKYTSQNNPHNPKPHRSSVGNPQPLLCLVISRRHQKESSDPKYKGIT